MTTTIRCIDNRRDSLTIWPFGEEATLEVREGRDCCTVAIGPAGARALRDALEAAFPSITRALKPTLPSPAADYLTPCPDEFSTVVGWLSVNRPEVIATLGDAPGCTQRDGFWLMHRCRERGIPEVGVRAPKVLADQGIDKVRAYPDSLLAERLGG
jgi:hypothetical protein